MVTENRDDAADIPIDADELSVFLRKQDAHTNGGSNGTGNGTGPSLSIPRAPGTIQETGLSTSFLLELMLKVFHYVETPTAEHLSRVMCVPNKIVNDLLDVLKTDKSCEIVGGGTYGVSTAYKFRLTEKGEARADQALERCRYAGAAPVTLEQYERVIGVTEVERWRPTMPIIREAFRELVLDSKTIDFLERALHSGRTLMLYGPSGNGKTHVLTEYIRHLDGEVLMPTSAFG